MWKNCYSRKFYKEKTSKKESHKILINIRLKTVKLSLQTIYDGFIIKEEYIYIIIARAW